MLTQMRRVDVIGNNISNSNTSGYKADSAVSASFDDMLIRRINDNGTSGRNPVVGPLNTGIYLDEVITEHTQGSLEQTGRSLDLAIKGNGFFVVQTQNGPRYTRGGSFYLDSEGYLAIGSGYRLMGENGPVQPNTENITIDTHGNIYIENMYADTLQLVAFDNASQLVKQGELLYQNTGAAQIDVNAQNAGADENADAPACEVVQGYLEGSNVNMTRELTQMMSAMQNYNSNQRIIRMLDETLAKTVNEVGRL
jgi:flagellar basal-body rod protein FlgF